MHRRMDALEKAVLALTTKCDQVLTVVSSRVNLLSEWEEAGIAEQSFSSDE